jgi:hypothetical protein
MRCRGTALLSVCPLPSGLRGGNIDNEFFAIKHVNTRREIAQHLLVPFSSSAATESGHLSWLRVEFTPFCQSFDTNSRVCAEQSRQ